MQAVLSPSCGRNSNRCGSGRGSGGGGGRGGASRGGASGSTKGVIMSAGYAQPGAPMQPAVHTQPHAQHAAPALQFGAPQPPPPQQRAGYGAPPAPG
eukprot:135973-Chlamydomonas_euryale.AAC.1